MRVAIVSDHLPRTADGASHVESLRRAFSEKISPVESADVVISTSRHAAGETAVPPGIPHVCYVTESAEYRPDTLAERRHRFNAQIAVVSATPTGATEIALSARRGITHYLAGNGVIATQLRQEIGRPVKVIYPAVDAHTFRPRKLRRSDHFLMLVDEADDTSLEIADEAAQIAGRRLVVGVKPSVQLPQMPHDHSHLQFVHVANQADLYDQLCKCQAFVCLSTADFDGNVIRAQACGTPVLVPAGGGLAELVLDAEQDGPGTGLLFEQRTPSEVASAMLELGRRPHKCSATLASAHAQAFSPARFEREIQAYLVAVIASSLPGTSDAPAADEQRRAA